MLTTAASSPAAPRVNRRIDTRARPAEARRQLLRFTFFIALCVAGCEGTPSSRPFADQPLDAAAASEPGDGSSLDANGVDQPGAPQPDAADVDAARPECQWSGAPGNCTTATACAAIPDRSAKPSASCAAGLACCIDTPDLADNPPTPAGYKLMMQSQVTPAMTNWAVMILHDPVTYPMFSTTTMTFGTLLVLALVEWHPPDFNNNTIHRGVTLFVPL
jgi:hypothetical protein